MRHQVKGRHLGRTAEHRKALYRNLVTALFEHGRIRTTEPKAREVRPLAEKMITLGKRGDLHARRQALRVVGNGTALERLFGPIAERFATRPGGYTRLIKAGRRVGDAAPLAYLELLEEAPRVARGSGSPGSGEEREEKKARGRAKAGAGEGAASRGRGKAKAKGAPAEGEGAKKKTSRRKAKAASPKSRGAGTPAQGETGRKSRRGEAHPEDV